MSADLSAAMPARCRCGHNKARHDVAGFDGECIGEGCRCIRYREVERTGPPATAGSAGRTDVGLPPQTAQILKAGRASGDRRAQLVADRIEALCTELGALLKAEAARAAADAARERAAQLKREIAAQPKAVGGHRASPPPATGVCPECGKPGLRNVGAHRTKAHGYRAAPVGGVGGGE